MHAPHPMFSRAGAIHTSVWGGRSAGMVRPRPHLATFAAHKPFMQSVKSHTGAFKNHQIRYAHAFDADGFFDS